MPCWRTGWWMRFSGYGRGGICIPGCRRCDVWGIGRFGSISMGLSISRPCGIRGCLLRGSCVSASLPGCAACPSGLLWIVVVGMLLSGFWGLLKVLLGVDFFALQAGFLPAAPWFRLFACGGGLSLLSYRSIRFAPVRGDTYFLCRRKES